MVCSVPNLTLISLLELKPALVVISSRLPACSAFKLHSQLALHYAGVQEFYRLKAHQLIDLLKEYSLIDRATVPTSTDYLLFFPWRGVLFFSPVRYSETAKVSQVEKRYNTSHLKYLVHISYLCL